MDEQLDDYAALKRRLLGRIAFAVVVLLGLLASLAVFDRINAPPPVVEKSVSTPALQSAATTVPAATAPVPDLIKSVEQPKEKESEAAIATEPVAAVPESSAAPKGLAPLSAPGEKPLTRPATGRHALMRSPELPSARVVPEQPAREAVARGTVLPQPARAAETVQTGPITQTAAKPYALQLGVFSDVANAEELRARLEKAGIRASIEARVQVGPFASKAEADAARTKLRELGIADALLLSMKGRKKP